MRGFAGHALSGVSLVAPEGNATGTIQVAAEREGEALAEKKGDELF